MDISMFRNHSRLLKNLFDRVSQFKKSNSNSKPTTELFIITKGVILLITAILFAWIGKTQIESLTRNQILQTEWPTEQVLISVLKQGGWSRIQSGDLSHYLKTHPDPFSNIPTIWKSSDHCFVYFYLSNDAELWSCATGQNQKPKLKWIKIGGGYSAINQLAQIHPIIEKKRTSYVDPKEIRY